MCRSAAIKLPSTPDIDYMPELGTDHDDSRTLQGYFKQQQQIQPQQRRNIPPQHPSVIATVAADISIDGRKLIDSHQISSLARISNNQIVSKPNKSNILNVSTPDSSQTDSDDVSPQIQRKRKSGHQRDILPRFSISIEDDMSA